MRSVACHPCVGEELALPAELDAIVGTYMSASKCWTEINKVQSFLKRINDKTADAIFFIIFLERWGRGVALSK